MKRRAVLQAFGAAALSAGCTRVGTTGGAEGGRHAWTIPHVLRYADGEDPVALVPLSASHASTSWLAELWAPWLLRNDEHFESVPELCSVVPTVENGLLSPDGRRITYKLRRTVWSDGTPFSSHDVAFTVKLIADPNTIVESREGWELIERVETPDARTAIFHLRSTYAGWASTFFSTGGANPCVLPAHILTGQNVNTGPYNAKPIGTGPFVIDEWARGQAITLSANPRYWRGVPKLRKIVYKVVPNDETLMTQLRAHDVDLWMQMNPLKLAEARALEHATIVRKRSTYWWHLDCNCSQPALAEIRSVKRSITRSTAK